MPVHMEAEVALVGVAAGWVAVVEAGEVVVVGVEVVDEVAAETEARQHMQI